MPDSRTSEDAQPRIADRRLWERVLYMLFCAIAYSVAEFVVFVVAIFQIACVAITGSINDRAQQLGRNVGVYIADLLQFVTFNDERVPFPFSDWPDETPGESPWRRETAAPAAPSAAPAPPEAAAPPPATREETPEPARDEGATSAPTDTSPDAPRPEDPSR